MTDTPLYYVNRGTLRVSQVDVMLRLSVETGDGAKPVCTLALSLQFAAALAAQLQHALDEYVLTQGTAEEEPPSMSPTLRTPPNGLVILHQNAAGVVALLEQGVRYRDIAKQYGVGKSSVERFARTWRPDTPPEAITQDQSAQIQAMLVAGYRHREILRELGLTQRSLTAWLAEHQEEIVNVSA